MGALVMLGTLFGLIALVFGLVLRYDPETRRPSTGDGTEATYGRETSETADEPGGGE